MQGKNTIMWQQRRCRYFPIGTAFTWGTREVTYVVVAHEAASTEIWHVCDNYYTDTGDDWGAARRLTADEINRCMDDGRAIMAADGLSAVQDIVNGKQPMPVTDEEDDLS